MSCAIGSYNGTQCEVSYWATFVDVTGTATPQLWKFNTNAGTLLEVFLGVDGSHQALSESLTDIGMNWNYSATNVPISAGSATLTLQVQDPMFVTVLNYLSTPALSLPTTLIPGATGTGCPDGPLCVPGTAQIASGSWNPSSAEEDLLPNVGNGFLGAFKYAGYQLFNTYVSVTASETRDVSNNTATVPLGKASGTVYVKYLYEGPQTDIPEPVTLGLLGSGLVGLGLLGRKRFRR